MARIITIARGIGSGGRTVGKMLSEDMGIKYYDKELIKLASDESGINERFFGLVDEKLSFLTLMITTLLLTEIFSIIRRR
jgi:cytidylate kinase